MVLFFNITERYYVVLGILFFFFVSITSNIALQWYGSLIVIAYT